ncbi:MAG: hypothetical protein C0467_12735 [Planctomycetaceae bacterium]|nr:hypothetical protein [Planctomycetaceae bacterium]
MKHVLLFTFVSAGAFAAVNEVSGRGYGGGGASFSHSSYSGGFEHSSGSFNSFSGGDRYGSYSGSRTTEAASGWGGRAAGTSYDHTWSDAAGASVTTSGSRGVAESRYGGVAAGGTRDTTVTTASGKTYTADRSAGVAAGAGGRTVGGASSTVDGVHGSASWNSAFSGNRYTGDMSHYSSVYGAGGVHSTAYWSGGYMTTRAGYVRTGFGYYGTFNAGWYTAHPGCWVAAGWAPGFAWNFATYPVIATYCSIPAINPPNYDYGSTVVYQDNTVYMDGQPQGTAQQYADQATAIATQGQTATAAPTEDWKPLGVYALVQGDEKTSNNIFQLAVNKDGIIRGNYYDGLMDTTTDVYGSVDKKTQRAAWTIGKKKDRVFEAGVYNLTQPQCSCLLHLGAQKTDQMMLVRVEQPKTNTPPATP